jgi:hypothetical protein
MLCLSFLADSHLDAVQGASEQGSPENLFSGVKMRTEPYMQYGEEEHWSWQCSNAPKMILTCLAMPG